MLPAPYLQHTAVGPTLTAPALLLPHDTLSSHPLPSLLSTQRWVCYQLLLAAAQCHGRGVVHGDIKSENVLLTSWAWVYLADFAAGLKPVALPADNPVRRTD